MNGKFPLNFNINIYFLKMNFKSGLITLYLVTILRSGEARSDVLGVLIPTAKTSWGDWSEWQYCPEGQVVNR